MEIFIRKCKYHKYFESASSPKWEDGTARKPIVHQIGYNNHIFSHLYQLTGRYGNEVTCRPPTLIWYPSTPARKVRTNNFPSTKGNGQVTSGFCSRPINLLNHEVVLDSFESTLSSRIHFSHLKCSSTATYVH